MMIIFGAYYTGELLNVNDEGNIPSSFVLKQNYPNPFNPSTNIEFSVPVNGRTTVKVFNVLGQDVATLFNDIAEAGRTNRVEFNGFGQASGMYFCRLEQNGNVRMKKMSFVK